MTKRSRRHTSRGRPSAKPSSRARRSRAMRSSSSAGDCQWRASWSSRQEGQAGRHDAVGGRRRRRRVVRPGAAVDDLVAEQVVVAAAEQRGAQRADDAEVVGGVVGGAQHHQQVAHGPGGVHERARLGAVRDVGRLEGVLEERQRGAGGHEDRDVAEPAGPPAVGPAASCTTHPSLSAVVMTWATSRLSAERTSSAPVP